MSGYQCIISFSPFQLVGVKFLPGAWSEKNMSAGTTSSALSQFAIDCQFILYPQHQSGPSTGIRPTIRTDSYKQFLRSLYGAGRKNPIQPRFCSQGNVRLEARCQPSPPRLGWAIPCFDLSGTTEMQLFLWPSTARQSNLPQTRSHDPAHKGNRRQVDLSSDCQHQTNLCSQTRVSKVAAE